MLSPDQIRELTNNKLLAKIAEESSEIIKAAMKQFAHGPRPFFEGVQYENAKDVIDEFEQLYSLMIEFKDRFA